MPGTVWERRKQQVEDLVTILLVILESIISYITYLLPEFVIEFCTSVVRFIFQNPYVLGFFQTKSRRNPIYDKYIDDQTDKFDDEKSFFDRIEALRMAKNFKEIIEINGYKTNNHVVVTKDNYLLCLQRLNPEDNGIEPNGKVVYFQHGLLMNSEIWVLMNEKELNLPFILLEQGYDIWFGNNRGNKYSNRHLTLSIDDKKFWNFSIDEFALYDLPNSIDYILNFTESSSLTYIGFSQGCSQILASISINNDLNEKIEKLILISPATTPHGLSNWVINTITNWSPNLMYTLFGKKVLLKSALFWQTIIYPPFFVKCIDVANLILFNWQSENIDIFQKFISYFHLYSTTSVKCVVHWFQIIKSKNFQMYHDFKIRNFQPFEYSTTQINTKEILLIYGKSDSLVDIDIIRSQLPKCYTGFKDYGSNGDLLKSIKAVSPSPSPFLSPSPSHSPLDSNKKEQLSTFQSNGDISNSELLKNSDRERNITSDKSLTIIGVEDYEHLDLIWGKNIDIFVINNVLEFLN